MLRIVIQPSHRYQALIAVHKHLGVQQTMQPVKKVLYQPGQKKGIVIARVEKRYCTSQGRKKVLYQPGQKKGIVLARIEKRYLLARVEKKTGFSSALADCQHREEVNLNNVEPFKDSAKNVNNALCMDLVGPLTLSRNKTRYILTMLDSLLSDSN